METGLKTTKKNNKTKAFSVVNLSIYLGYTEIVFVVFDAIESQILNRSSLSYKDINQVNDLVFNYLIDNEYNSFNIIDVIHFNNLNTVVPQALFDKKNIKDYLKFNNTILETDQYWFDHVEDNDSVNVFIPILFDSNKLKQYTKDVKQRHYTTCLISEIFKIENNNINPNVYININKSKLDVVLISKNKLKFINTFDYSSNEDIVYYILFCYEQLSLNPENSPIIISGKIDDSIFNIIYKYIRNVTLFESKIKSSKKYYNNFKNELITPFFK
jgi:hypothetical protein